MSEERQVRSKKWDVAIIGGGMAGGTAAYHLAQAGLRVVLFEKEKSRHHKVCGEFISGEGAPLLEDIGLNLRDLGGTTIRKFRLHGPHKTGEAQLPFAAVGLSRAIVDDAILNRAEEAGATIHRGVLVKDQTSGFDHPAGGECGEFKLSTSAGEFFADRVVIATGKYEFNGVGRRAGRDSGLVGFKMHLKLRPSALKQLSDHCDLFVFDGGYGGLAPIENGLANFCFLIERSKLKTLKATWDHLASHIAKSNEAMSHYLDGAEPQFANFVTVPKVPYGFLRREKPEAGTFCVGDQMAVIPSLSGDGMTIALRTGLAAAAAIIKSRETKSSAAVASTEYQKRTRSALRTQIETAYILHRLFKNPRLCDLAAYAIRRFPAVLDFFFSNTRCHLPGTLQSSFGAPSRASFPERLNRLQT
jgi:flavin-dependent dehydrogenase